MLNVQEGGSLAGNESATTLSTSDSE